MELPKSYLSEEEKKGLTPNVRYLDESFAALVAGDEETSLAWLSLADLPAHTLLTLKQMQGADFLIRAGFNLAPAEAAYGKDWLEIEAP